MMEMHRISPTNAHPIAMANPPRIIPQDIPRTHMISSFRFRSIPRMFSFTILPEIMTETRDATLSSPLIHPRTVIQADRMR